MKKIITTIYLTPKQHEALRRLSFEARITMSSIIRRAIDKFLKEENNG